MMQHRAIVRSLVLSILVLLVVLGGITAALVFDSREAAAEARMDLVRMLETDEPPQ